MTKKSKVQGVFVYALRRVSDKTWISSSGYTCVEPETYGLLETAQRKRLEIMITRFDKRQKANRIKIIDDIEICRLALKLTVDRAISKSEIDIEISDMIKKASETLIKMKPLIPRPSRELPRNLSFQFKDLECLLWKNAEKKRNIKMNCAAFIVDDYSKDQDRLEFDSTEMRRVAKYTHKNNVYLIRSVEDFALMKVCGFDADLVYDFENKAFIKFDL